MHAFFSHIIRFGRLSNWTAIGLFLLVLSLPVQQYAQDKSTFNWEQQEQQEQGDKDSEKEKKEKTQEVDSDDFLIESLTINHCSLYHSRLAQERKINAQFGICPIFDPPPEV